MGQTYIKSLLSTFFNRKESTKSASTIPLCFSTSAPSIKKAKHLSSKYSDSINSWHTIAFSSLFKRQLSSPASPYPTPLPN